MQMTVKKRKEILRRELKRIVNTLVKDYLPEKIILFGSLAQDKIHEYSDIDLAIIKKTDEPFIQRLHRVHLLAAPNVGVNFIVYTPGEVQRMIEQKHYFFRDEILMKGRLIYERNK